MRTLRLLGAVFVGVLVVACGSSGSSSPATPVDGGAPQGSVDGGPQNPLGTVGGLILNVVGDTPLPEVAVNIISAGMTFTGKTDKNGLYAIPNVPAGAFTLTTSLAGFEGALTTGTLSGAQGTSLVGNPIQTMTPIGLFPTSGTFAVKIVDEYGAPAPNVKVTARPQVRFFDYGSGVPSPRGAYAVLGTSGADGIVNLTGLPPYISFGNLGSNIASLPIDVAPIQVSGSAVYTFLGGTFTFNLWALSATPFADQAVIRLAGPTSNLIILDSNIQFLRGQDSNNTRTFGAVGSPIGVSEPISITFNQSITPSSVRAQLLNEDGTIASTPLTQSVVSNQLTLTPTAPLKAGGRYNLALHANAQALTGSSGAVREVDVTAPIFIQAASAPQVSTQVPAKLSTDKLSFIVQFSEPIGLGFASTAGVSCVVYYDGVNLDGDATTVFPGEYNGGTGLTCPNPSQDITAMTPLEAATGPGMPITGFTTRWQVTFDNTGAGGCKSGVAKGTACTPPAPGTAVHFVFSRTPGTVTLKRADGTPVPDSAAMTLAIPQP